MVIVIFPPDPATEYQRPGPSLDTPKQIGRSSRVALRVEPKIAELSSIAPKHESFGGRGTTVGGEVEAAVGMATAVGGRTGDSVGEGDGTIGAAPCSVGTATGDPRPEGKQFP